MTCRFSRSLSIGAAFSTQSSCSRSGVCHIPSLSKPEVKDAKAAKALDHAAALLAALLPLIICGYLLYHMQRGSHDEANAEVLVGEIVSEHPTLLPRDDEPRLALTANRVGQLNAPDGQKEGSE